MALVEASFLKVSGEEAVVKEKIMAICCVLNAMIERITMKTEKAQQVGLIPARAMDIQRCMWITK